MASVFVSDGQDLHMVSPRVNYGGSLGSNGLVWKRFSKIGMGLLNRYFTVLAPHCTTVYLRHTKVLCYPLGCSYGAMEGIVIHFLLLVVLLGCLFAH